VKAALPSHLMWLAAYYFKHRERSEWPYLGVWRLVEWVGVGKPRRLYGGQYGYHDS
jgi:hypothetical protein